MEAKEDRLSRWVFHWFLVPVSYQTKDSRGGFGIFCFSMGSFLSEPVVLWQLPSPSIITSPGTHSSSRAHQGCRPTPFPWIVTLSIYRLARELCMCMFTPTITISQKKGSCPLRSVVFFSLLCVLVLWNPGSTASSHYWCCWSRTCWSGGARLSSQESRHLARLLHSDRLPEYTQIRARRQGRKRRKWIKSCMKRHKKASLVQLIPTLGRLVWYIFI